MNEQELLINRKTTKAFIDADAISIVLTPVTFEKTAGGGRKGTDGDPKETASYRMIPQGDVMVSVQTPDGITLTPTYVLMGEWDSAMERWDKFTLNGVNYQIVSPIRPHHTSESRYFSKADVARY